MKEVIDTVGRRKTSVARVFMSPGKGRVIINKLPAEEYFRDEVKRQQALRPLALTEKMEDFDIKVNVHGGGVSGQTGAVSLAIARALTEFDESARAVLKKEKLLTRDPRMVERKKFGRKKARKRFQFSKR
ncbi:30S ribosomal protein S9 [Chlorobium phaeobacteroides]|jgi:small subunit ribosomal protein S9|uniref:Small ribosomal subunit protein uS9 n=1 Tax=Chlorobium phaeobacteroides (strain DSM 266 / SMG 266 / 2430) TaxID=290317 RepID=RS9_CHLPD|nr:30S ribosomal protein S9 [Chlorobium phaeobacteroides]A1BHZ6.1 RecName: Full=Small ribosomal subunit protein uS9; AltName: Full=30S ribosomal protein S9 [Chlorobium phaeobacteroides DSM 266]ABL66023.1 SSU ribosomal protein S9P [Chlorobium phaeobacteroides DSM 266]MBV5326471.1 30S ribosomal protein S9 [Chlorobium sp.]